MRIPDGWLSTLLEIAGMALGAAAAFSISVSAGLIAVGVVLVAAGMALGDRTRL